MQFGYTKLGWVSDANWRLSGPSVVPANPRLPTISITMVPIFH